MENVAVQHDTSATGQTALPINVECPGSSQYLAPNLQKGDASVVWHDPINKPGPSKCREMMMSGENYVSTAANCTLTEHCLSSELKERLSLNASTENVNGLINGSADSLDHQQFETSEETSVTTNSSSLVEPSTIDYVQYESEVQMPLIMKIIQKDLSEPYSIYTYRYFIHNWPKLCFLAMCGDKCVGAIVCKLDIHRKVTSRGYIAMLAVDQNYRKRSIGSTLVKRAIREMIKGGADEVVLETEVTNKPALRLYEALGFVRDKRLFRYYLNGVDALRLKLWLR